MEWEDSAGKMWTIILFLVIAIVFFLIIAKVVPEMQSVSGFFDRLFE